MYLVMHLLNVIAFIGIVCVMVIKYRNTRDRGFIWLGLALVIWPLVAYCLEAGERVLINRLSEGQTVSLYPFSLVSQGRITIGKLVATLGSFRSFIKSVLILTGLAMLYRGSRSVGLVDKQTGKPQAA